MTSNSISLNSISLNSISLNSISLNISEPAKLKLINLNLDEDEDENIENLLNIINILKKDLELVINKRKADIDTIRTLKEENKILKINDEINNAIISDLKADNTHIKDEKYIVKKDDNDFVNYKMYTIIDK